MTTCVDGEDSSIGGLYWIRDDPNDYSNVGGDGEAMIVQARTGSLSKEAVMFSVDLGNASSHCVANFSYYKEGGAFGSSNLNIIVKTNKGIMDTRWSVKDDMGSSVA